MTRRAVPSMAFMVFSLTLLVALAPQEAAAQEVSPFAPMLPLLSRIADIVQGVVVAIGAISITFAVIRGIISGNLDLMGILAILVGAVLVFIAGPVAEFMAPTGAVASVTPPGGTTVYQCVFCEEINAMGAASSVFRETAFLSLSGPAYQLVRIGVLIDVMLFSGALFLGGGGALKSFGPALISRVLWYSVAAGILIDPTFLPEAMAAVEQTSLSVGNAVFEYMREFFIVDGVDWKDMVHDQPFVADAGGGYGYLWANVEMTVYPILDLIKSEWANLDTGWDVGKGIVITVSLLLLAVPMALVMLIFATYLVQLMFYFLAIQSVGPLLLLCLIFKPTRGMVWASLKFLLGGFLTIVFASMAMAFTGAIIVMGAQSLWLDGGNTGFVGEALIAAANASPGSTQNTLTQNNAMIEMMAVAGDSYWLLLLVTGLSVMLHLNAPKVASNLAGSNDSATNAAMALAAGQYAMSRSVGMASKVLFGNEIRGGGSLRAISGGVGGFFQGMFSGASGGTFADVTAGGGDAIDTGVLGAGGRKASAAAGYAAGAAARGIGAGLKGLQSFISGGGFNGR